MGAWYDEAVFYHIYPLGLSGAPMDNRESGTHHRFEELMDWIPHMKELGVTAVYIGPLFESSTHGYDTKDYKRVDRRLGDNEDFKRFVSDCHKAAIRVVVDGVFNHTGREFFAFEDILKNREGSRYCGWYKNVSFGGNTPYNDGFYYEAWRNCFELANLNLANPEVKEYLLSVIRGWIEEYDIDGIRLDCADCLDFGFMADMRRVTGELKEDFWLMGEVIHGDYSRFAGPGMLHSVTNYELHKGLYSGHNDHNYFEIAHTIRREFDENGGIYKGLNLYSFVDNHDVDRIASKLNDKGHLKPVLMLLYTLPGIPSIYYGSEWGIEGRKEGGNDAPLRPAINIKEMEDNEILQLVKALGVMHGQHLNALTGRYRELMLTNRQYAFARMGTEELLVVAVNNDEQPSEVSIALPDGSVATMTDALTGEEVDTAGGRLLVTLAGNDGRIFTAKLK